MKNKKWEAQKIKNLKTPTKSYFSKWNFILFAWKRRKRPGTKNRIKTTKKQTNSRYVYWYYDEANASPNEQLMAIMLRLINAIKSNLLYEKLSINFDIDAGF